MNKNTEELLNLMMSKTPIIYIVGNDEKSILDSIKICGSSIKLANMKAENKTVNTEKDSPDDSFGLLEWSAISSLRVNYLVDDPDKKWKNLVNGQEETAILAVEDKASEKPATGELMEALEYAGNDVPLFKQYNFNHRVTILKDIHKHLESNPYVVRKLKEIVLFEDKNDIVTNQIIIVSPILFIPQEFQNYVHVIEWKLPNKEEVMEYLNEKIKSITFDKDKDVYKDCLTNAIYTKEDLNGIISNFTGLSFPEIKNTSNLSKQKAAKLDQTLILEQKKQVVMKSGILEYLDCPYGMDDVGGMDNFKKWVSMRKMALGPEAKAFGVETPKGALVVGIQGCGKSLSAKSLAADWGIALLRLDIGKVFGGTVGSSEEKMRLAISVIEATTPNVVLVDEIDKGLAGSQSSNYSDGGTTSRVIGSFMTWLQEKTCPSFIIATANDITLLPPALLRKGRFDEIFFFGLHSQKEREEIFSIHLKHRGRNPENFNIKEFAKKSKLFSGAEIEETIKSAIISAFYNKKSDIDNSDILESIQNTIPSAKTVQEEIGKLYTWVGWDEDKKDGVRARYASSSSEHDWVNGEVVAAI